MRDHRGRSAPPRPLAAAVESFRESIAPETPLAAAQTVWERAVGAQIAAVARPVGERDGTIEIECESAVWAEELTLMEPRLRDRLNREMGGDGPEKLRFRAGSATDR